MPQGGVKCATITLMKNFFMQPINGKILLGIGLSVVSLSSFGYIFYTYIHTINKLDVLSTDLVNTKNEYQAKIYENQTDIKKMSDEISSIVNTLTDEQKKSLLIGDQLGAIGQQVGAIGGTVGNLEKLSKTDPELLKKYSKVYFLNEHYVPLSLSNIDSKYLIIKNTPLQIHSSVAPYLQRLLDDSTSSGLSPEIISAFRSFGSQALLKSSYKFTYGAGTANAFSAEQGYSEHQLGTTVDFATPTTGTGFSGFDKTPEYTWLTNNAYKYGFIISYPENNSYYKYEPWHWRFVGVALATTLHNRNEYFYNMDQREIDTYLANIFD